jgi:hypothetical protein
VIRAGAQVITPQTRSQPIYAALPRTASPQISVRREELCDCGAATRLAIRLDGQSRADALALIN